MGIGPFTKKDHLTISSLGFEFAIAQAVGVGIGYFLDSYLGTRPWLTIAGLFLGFVLGIYIVVQAAQSMDRQNTNLQKADKKDGRR